MTRPLFLRAALPLAMIGLLQGGEALAADYNPPIYVADPVEEYAPVEVGNGWYLRGDIGYSVYDRIGGLASYRTFDPLTSTYSQSIFDTSSIESDMNFGVGVGYQYNEWIRGDLTVNSVGGRFDGTTSSLFPCGGSPAGTTCRSEDEASYSGATVLANGYVDLGTYAGFTPYVGAGAGMTYLDWGTMTNNGYCVPGAVACPDPGGIVNISTHEGLNSWRFTYALMGGVAFDISRNLKIDVGYKYTHVAGGDMFGWDAGSIAAGALGVQGSDEGFAQHDVRVGLRYSLF